jgi:site-specific recombinase XerD
MARAKETRDPFFDFFYQFFEKYLPGARNCSPATVKSYRSTFRMLERYCDTCTGQPFSKMTMDTFDHGLVVSFMAWLKDDLGNLPATMALRLAAVKSFLHFCAARDTIYTSNRDSVCQIASPKVPDRGVAALSQDGLAALLEQPDPERPKGLRDLTFMTLMYDAGARMQEVLGLRLCDIALEDGIACLWLTGKGNRRRKVPIDNKAAEHLLRYIGEFHQGGAGNSTDLLFYTVIHGKRCPMSDDCARAFIKKYAGKAHDAGGNLPVNIHPHQLRHTRALHLYQAGNSLITVRDFLGHRSIATTDIYARADARMLAEAVRRVTPAAEGETEDWLKPDMAQQLEAFLRKYRTPNSC